VGKKKEQIKLFSAGAVIVRKTETGFLYLLLRAYNHWDFPKGVVEKGESPFEAALREIKEETELSELVFPKGYIFIESGPYGAHKKVARYYLAETNQEEINLPVNPELGKPEHEEYRWLAFRDALQLVSNRVETILNWANSNLNE